MLDATHQFFLCVRDNEGRELFRKEAEPLQTVYEDLLYSAVLAGEVPNDGTSPPVTIEPEFRDSRLHAVHAALGLRTKRYTLDLFRDQASQILASPELVERAKGATLSWDVEAKAIDTNAGSKPRRASILREPFPFTRSSLASLGVRPTEDGAARSSLFVTSELLKELKEETASSLERERADALTGHVAVGVDKTASVVLKGRIPFPDGADASATHYAFTPEAFGEVHREHRLRGDGESLLGWHHNHPPPCGRDCLARVPACETATVFLSADDRAVFRSSFAAPFQIGLVSGKGSGRRPEDPIVHAYGWRDGVLEEMSYVVF